MNLIIHACGPMGGDPASVGGSPVRCRSTVACHSELGTQYHTVLMTVAL